MEVVGGRVSSVQEGDGLRGLATLSLTLELQSLSSRYRGWRHISDSHT